MTEHIFFQIETRWLFCNAHRRKTNHVQFVRFNAHVLLGSRFARNVHTGHKRAHGCGVKAFDLRRSERTRKENTNMHEISANSEAAFNTIRENYKRTSHYTTAHQQNLKHGATC